MKKLFVGVLLSVCLVVSMAHAESYQDAEYYAEGYCANFGRGCQVDKENKTIFVRDLSFHPQHAWASRVCYHAFGQGQLNRGNLKYWKREYPQQLYKEKAMDKYGWKIIVDWQGNGGSRVQYDSWIGSSGLVFHCQKKTLLT